MMIQLSSLISEIALLSRSSIHLDYGRNSMLLLIHVRNPAEVYCTNRMYSLSKDTMILCSKLQFVNPGAEILRLRGYAFASKNSKEMKEPCIFSSQDHLKSELVSTIFNKRIDVPSDIHEIERLFTELYQLCSAEIEASYEMNDCKSKGVIDSRLLIINRHIRNHYNQPLTLDSLADLIGCNPVYMSNMYSKIFLISPMRYLQTVRMNKSLKLLANTGLSITEISHEIGYISNSQFGSLFKRYYGITPYEYRIKHFILQSKQS